MDRERESEAVSGAPLRRRLALLLLGAIVPICALGSLLLFIRIDDMNAQFKAELMANARLVAGDRDRTFRRVRDVLRIVDAQEIATRAGNSACSAGLARVTRALASLVDLAIVDRQGKFLCTAKAPSDLFNVRRAEWFRRAMNGSPLSVGASTAENRAPAVIVAIPSVAGDETPRYVIAGAIAADDLMVDPKASRISDYDFALITASGRALVATPYDNRFAARPGWFPENREQMRGDLREARYFEEQSQDGRNRAYALVPILGGQLITTISAPTAQRDGAWMMNASVALGLPLLVCLAAFGVVWIGIDRLITSWLFKLGRLADLYGRGRYSVRASGFDRAPRELQDFAFKLNAMADAVEQRDRDLRASVALNRSHVREVHHRVRNNLQIVLSLLRNRRREAAGDGEARALGEIESRVRAIGLAYGRMTNPENASSLSAVEIIRGVIGGEGGAAVDELPAARLSATDDQVIDMDQAVPLALLVNEAIEICNLAARGEEAGTAPVDIVAEGAPLGITIRIPKECGAAAKGKLSERLLMAFASQINAEVDDDSDPDALVIEVVLEQAKSWRSAVDDAEDRDGRK